MYNQIKIALIPLLFIATSVAEKAVLKEILPIKNVWSIYIAEDGKRVNIRFKGGEDLSQIVQFQNTGAGQIRDAETWHTIKDFKNVRFFHFAPDSRIVAVIFANGDAHIVDVENDIVLKKFNDVWHVIFSPNGKLAKVIFNTCTCLYETEHWQVIREFQHTACAWEPFSGDSNYVVIPFADGIAQIVSLEDWHVVREFTDIAHFGIRFSDDGTLLAVIYKNNIAQILKRADWSIIKEFYDIKSLNFSPNGKYIWAKRTNKMLEIINLNDWHVLIQQPKNLFSALSVDGKYLWVILLENTSVQVIDMETGEIILDGLQNAEECCFSPTKKELVVALSDEVRLYEIK